ncbi:MAG: family 16 glycosylhydrolase, partial [Planctomycetes bacterium]|nr:family 16 glycosylhydrolase [Planctomycetota bacterium]
MATLLLCAQLSADDQKLIDFESPDAKAMLSVNAPDNGECTFDITKGEGNYTKVLGVKIKDGANSYPGLTIKPKEGTWDLSKYGRVEVAITNNGEKPVTVCVRVDNEGDWKQSPWSSENTKIDPGKTKTAKVTFGYSWGKPGYKLDSSKVSAILIFTGKPKGTEFNFTVKSVTATGKAGDKPGGFVTRVKPKDGSIIDLSKADAKNLIEERGATVELSGDGTAKLSFSPEEKNKWPAAFFAAPEGVIWDLGNFIQVDFSISNPGDKPVRVMCRVDNKGANGSSKCATGIKEIQPGTVDTVTASFIPEKPWNGNIKNSGASISSTDVIGALVFIDKPSEPTSIIVKSIKASNPTPSVPDWLGKRPPVEGDWVVTFNDDFNGDSIDETKWRYYGPNYWDKKTRWSKDNMFVKDGMAVMRYEKKKGFHNDDPKEKEKEFTCGFLESYGKWTQLYGYFEARMKLPTAPGLWPAFWMMPDRGKEAGEQWKRQDTKNGGMEFDIMEHLTRWGPNRYNIAMHWNGYQKEHKSIGSTCVYAQPDKDGFITCGVLWQPGLLVY